MFTTTNVHVASWAETELIGVSWFTDSVVGGVTVSFGAVHVTFIGPDGQAQAAAALRRLADEVEALS